MVGIRSFPIGFRPIFRGHVSFREGRWQPESPSFFRKKGWLKMKGKSRWWQRKYLLMFTPIFWGRWTHFDEHIFWMGWFNHQLEIMRGPLLRDYEGPPPVLNGGVGRVGTREDRFPWEKFPRGESDEVQQLWDVICRAFMWLGWYPPQLPSNSSTFRLGDPKLNTSFATRILGDPC